MSLEALDWAWSQSTTPSQKLVLLALADHHNTKTGQCNPSINRIAGRTCLARRSIERAIGGLEQAGLLVTHKQQGKTSRYSLALTSDTVTQDQRHCDAGPASESRNTCDTVTPKPERTGKEPPRNRAHALTDAFEPRVEDWQWAEEAYPDIDARSETEQFINHFIATGKKYVDWYRAWRNWITRAHKWNKPSATGPAGPQARRMAVISKTNRERTERALARRAGLSDTGSGPEPVQFAVIEGGRQSG